MGMGGLQAGWGLRVVARIIEVLFSDEVDVRDCAIFSHNLPWK